MHHAKLGRKKSHNTTIRLTDEPKSTSAAPSRTTARCCSGGRVHNAEQRLDKAHEALVSAVPDRKFDVLCLASALRLELPANLSSKSWRVGGQVPALYCASTWRVSKIRILRPRMRNRLTIQLLKVLFCCLACQEKCDAVFGRCSERPDRRADSHPHTLARRRFPQPSVGNASGYEVIRRPLQMKVSARPKLSLFLCAV
jgi:hypothetical protein